MATGQTLPTDDSAGVVGHLGRCTDQGGGGGGDGTEGEPELSVLGAVGEPTAWTVGSAVGKPVTFCDTGCEEGDGTEGEPELRVLDTVGEPTAGTASAAVGKPANNELTMYVLL